MFYNSVADVIARVQNVVEFIDRPILSIDQRGIFGNTPLAVVMSWNDSDAVRLLVEAGADINAKVEDGDTPLHRAVCFRNLYAIRLLLERNVARNELNLMGNTPHDIALLSGDEQIISLLGSCADTRTV